MSEPTPAGVGVTILMVRWGQGAPCASAVPMVQCKPAAHTSTSVVILFICLVS